PALMQRRPLIVGVLIALVGAALILWIQRGADSVPESAAPTSTATAATTEPVATATAPPSAEATAEPPTADSDIATDSSLRIPGIDLRVDLHPEGLRGGKINPPAGTVMWYTGHEAAAPGAVATSVIAAHVTARGPPHSSAALA